MAQKKYVSLEKLGLYDEKLKTLINSKDADILARAKAYCDDKDDQFEVAGSVATAKSELQNKIDAVEAKADAASAANTTTQGEVDALEALVGVLPTGSDATSVVDYINKKTAGIATDTALAELQTQVNANKTDITAIKGDYLKTADKTELNDLIAAEATTARAAEKKNADDIAAISADYLKASDKTALETSIAAAKKAGDDAQADIDAFLAAAEVGDAAIDTLKEIQDYISGHGEAAATMTNNIAANASAISALDDKVGDIPEGTIATDVVSYVQEVVGAEQTRATNAESNLNTRLDAIESAVGESGSVATDIATAKQEAIDNAVAVATSKANQALTDAKAYADGLNTAMDERVDILETTTHTHDNKALLDTYTQTEADLADAVAKKHSHTNLEVLEGITAIEVSAWDAAEQNAKTYAKTYADGLNTSMASRMDAVEAWQNSMIECSEEEIAQLFA